MVNPFVHCKTCHYSLANLTEHRCPECGTAFDPNDPTTFDITNDQADRGRPMEMLVYTLLTVALVCIWFILTRRL